MVVSTNNPGMGWPKGSRAMLPSPRQPSLVLWGLYDVTSSQKRHILRAPISIPQNPDWLLDSRNSDTTKNGNKKNKTETRKHTSRAFSEILQ